MAADSSCKIMRTRKKGHTIFQMRGKKRNDQPRIPYPEKIPSEKKIKIFSNEGEQREFIVSRPNRKQQPKAHSLNGKRMIKEGTLKYLEEGKKTVSKNMSKYSRVFLSFLNYT